jgi:RNA polymerase-binding transcription factor DksA
MRNKNMNNIENKCEKLYSKHGAGAVRDYCKKIGHKTYSFCGQCDTEVPVLNEKAIGGDTSCLICGAVTSKCGNVFFLKGTAP